MPAEIASLDRAPSLQQTLQDAPESTEPLDRAEERRLLRRYAETGDVAIRNLLVRANFRWAIKRAADYARRTDLPYEDCASAALHGLLRGVEEYDVEHSDAVRLISYAD